MIISIERNKFIYLYKYDEVRVDINQVIDHSVEYLKFMLQSDFKEIVALFEKVIPLFEQDHEIIMLEVDKSKLKFQDGIVISFDSINRIYPLTKIGSQLLHGKISEDFIVEVPFFEMVIEELKIIRSMKFRRKTSEKILAHFKLDSILNLEMISTIEVAVKKNLMDKIKSQEFTSYLDHLIAYNKTPSYIPDGNIEHISKIGAIAIKFMGKPEEVFTNGPFYKSTLQYKLKINNKSYLDSYEEFISIANDELKTSYEKMLEIISKDYKGIDIFKISYFFLAFKSNINKHDNNIEGISNHIADLIKNDKFTSAFVLSLLGYTFSFENIYEGLHRLFNAPLLKSSVKRKRLEIDNEKPSDKIESKIETSDRDKINSDDHNDEIKNSDKLDSDEKELENTTESQSYTDSKMVEAPISIGESIELSVGKSKPNKNRKSIPAPYNIESGVNDNSVVAESMASYDIKKKSNSGFEGNITVEFKEWIVKKCPSNKINHWNAFLAKFFINENLDITPDRLADILEKYPDQDQKIFGAKNASSTKLKKEIASFLHKDKPL